MAQSLGRQPTDTEFAAALRSETGLDLPAFREYLRKQLTIQKYLMSKKKSVIEAVKAPTEADILREYNLAKAQFIRPDTVRYTIIQVPFGTDPAEKTRARELGDQLVREIGSNASKFDEVVVRSQAQGSALAYRAGDGGYLPRNTQALQVVGQVFLDAAFTLKQGEVSRLLETPQAFNIIKITETYEQKSLGLDDLYQLCSQGTIRDYIRQAMLQQVQQAAIDQATQELVTELRAGNPFQVYDNNLTW
jgi:parvulin-like peptidyl-prolyl isomerase